MEDLFKTLVWDVMIKAAIQRLFLAIPWLGWGPLGIIVGWVIGHFATQFYEIAKLSIKLEIIVLRNDAHHKAYQDAAVKLQIIARDKGIGSQEYKDAREKDKQALSDFVRFAAA